MAKPRTQKLPPVAPLARGYLNEKRLPLVPIRDGYGKGLLELGQTNPKIVVLVADLVESTRSEWFAKAFPDRFIEVGITEQHMVTMASGLSATGWIPFVSSYAAFSPGRNWEQIRTTIAYNDRHVIIAGSHAGISVGPDGATHQMTEDLAIMRAMPNFTVLAPCDAVEAQKATTAAAQVGHPVYIRFAREKTPQFTTDKTPFKIGQAQVFRPGTDVTIVACGALVYESLQAAEMLRGRVSVQVINSPSLKPLDVKTIVRAARDTGAMVAVEEANVIGGLGGAVAETLARELPTPLEFVGMQDMFGESGPPNALWKKYGLNRDAIIQAVHRVMKRKK